MVKYGRLLLVNLKNEINYILILFSKYFKIWTCFNNLVSLIETKKFYSFSFDLKISLKINHLKIALFNLKRIEYNYKKKRIKMRKKILSFSEFKFISMTKGVPKYQNDFYSLICLGDLNVNCGERK